MNESKETEKREKLIDAADADAEAELANSPERSHMGFCHTFWGTKKRILKEKYGIEWLTPAEENPWINYD